MTVTVHQGIIRWEAPPPATPGLATRRPHRAWALVAAQLSDKPNRGCWALIDEPRTLRNSGSICNRINNGESWWGPPGSYYAVTRTIDGEPYIFAVYLGPNFEYADKAGVDIVHGFPRLRR